jgi:acyl carrier protein
MNEEIASVVREAIFEIGGIDVVLLQPGVNLLDDLKMDSVDVLDVIFQLEERLGISIPIGKWAEKITSGTVSTEHYFAFGHLVDHLEELVANGVNT